MNTNKDWKLVPVEPTTEMLDAARRRPLPALMVDSYTARENLDTGARYRAMVFAAPEAPPLTVTVDPDARGVSVGVYQGPRCVYSGAHPVPAAGWLDIASAPKDGTPVLLFARHIDAEASTRVVGWFHSEYGWIAQSYVGQPFARLIPSLWAELMPFPGSPASTVATEGEKDERQKFEAWHKREFGSFVPEVTNHYNRWLGWEGRSSVAAPAAGDALDAARYRWLRDPQTDVALVLDKRTGYVPEDESIPGVGGYHTYEYRAGEELDAAIDAAIAQQSQRKEA